MMILLQPLLIRHRGVCSVLRPLLVLLLYNIVGRMIRFSMIRFLSRDVSLRVRPGLGATVAPSSPSYWEGRARAGVMISGRQGALTHLVFGVTSHRGNPRGGAIGFIGPPLPRLRRHPW